MLKPLLSKPVVSRKFAPKPKAVAKPTPSPSASISESSVAALVVQDVPATASSAPVHVVKTEPAEKACSPLAVDSGSRENSASVDASDIVSTESGDSSASLASVAPIAATCNKEPSATRRDRDPAEVAARAAAKAVAAARTAAAHAAAAADLNRTLRAVRESSLQRQDSILPPSVYGAHCPYELYTIYLRKQLNEGLGLKLKNIDETPVVVGFAPSFAMLQAAAMASKVQVYDVIVAVNNVDIRTHNVGYGSANGAGGGTAAAVGQKRGRRCKDGAEEGGVDGQPRGRRRRVGAADASANGSLAAGPAGPHYHSNFDKIIGALRDTACSAGKTPGAGSSVQSAAQQQQQPTISISLSTIDSSIVCITLARPRPTSPMAFLTGEGCGVPPPAAPAPPCAVAEAKPRVELASQ